MLSTFCFNSISNQYIENTITWSQGEYFYYLLWARLPTLLSKREISNEPERNLF